MLLDHMDWLSEHRMSALAEEWQMIASRAADHSRVIWRSGGFRTDYLNEISVNYRGSVVRVPEMLTMEPEKAAQLHELDRVGT